MVLLGFATGLKFCRPPKVSIRLHSPLLFPAKNMNRWWVTWGTCRFERFKRVVWRIGTPKSQSWWRVQSFPQFAWCLEIWGTSSSTQTKNIANSCCWDDCNFPSYGPDLMGPCHPLQVLQAAGIGHICGNGIHMFQYLRQTELTDFSRGGKSAEKRRRAQRTWL